VIVEVRGREGRESVFVCGGDLLNYELKNLINLPAGLF